jgi:Holliday junction resolvase-like predicted endonuclease
MMRVYAVMEGNRIVKMSQSRHQCVYFLDSLPEERRKQMRITAQVFVKQRKRHKRAFRFDEDRGEQ